MAIKNLTVAKEGTTALNTFKWPVNKDHTQSNEKISKYMTNGKKCLYEDSVVADKHAPKAFKNPSRELTDSNVPAKRTLLSGTCLCFLVVIVSFVIVIGTILEAPFRSNILSTSSYDNDAGVDQNDANDHANNKSKWTQKGTDVEGRSFTNLGQTVALSGDGDELWASGNGVLKFFVLSRQREWTPTQDLSSDVTAYVGSNYDGTIHVGLAIALDGSTFVVGDPCHYLNTGRATVYRRTLTTDGAVWERYGEPLVGESFFDWFGDAVAVNGNGTVFIVGASGGTYAHVYRYEDEEEGTSRNATLVTKIQSEAGSEFGVSAAVSTDAARLIVGAPEFSAAHVFSLFPEHSPTQTLYGDETEDHFGRSVDVSSKGDVLVVGAPHADYVAIYAANDSSRQLYSRPTDLVRGPRKNSLFGATVSVSADGDRLAVGAPWDARRDRKRSRVVARSGRSFVYAIGSNGHKTIGEFVGDASHDEHGYSAFFSKNGARVAVGARGSSNSRGGKNSGRVRVFELIGDDDHY